MDGTDTDTKIAALTAIVQTLVLEHYGQEDEEEARQRFLAMAEADYPVAMAIINELTEAELDAAFRWPGKNKGEEDGLPATPVITFLSEEQRERVRVTSVAEDEGDRARAFATEEPDVPGAALFLTSERVRLAEERFVSAMVEELVRRRGEEVRPRSKGTFDETIAAMPEPWSSRTKRELERLRKDLGKMLGGETRADDNGDSKDETSLSAG